MRRKTTLLNFTIALTTGLLLVRAASANVGRPDVDAIAATTQPSIPADLPLHTQAREISSYSEGSDGGKTLADLRPVRRDDGIDFNEATQLLNTKTLNEQIFNKEFTGKMQGQYVGSVKPYEQTANDPVWRARYWETQRYDEARQGVAKWTTHEVMEDQLKDFFNGADKNSGAMKAMSTARSLTGGEEDKPAEKKLTPEEVAARAHRTDLPQPVAQEDEVTPTKLKTKMNLLKQNGAVVFTNPVATTEINGNKDDVSMNMHRDFRKIQASSNLNYGVRQGCLNFNVSKKITERVSLDLSHVNYTGDQRDGSGYKSREQAKVNYSLSF